MANDNDLGATQSPDRPTGAEFVERVLSVGVLTVEELESFLATTPDAAIGDAAGMAAALVRRGLLTQHQARGVFLNQTELLVFDDYVVLDKIGQGGMGAVFRARHRRMDRIVAVKILKPNKPMDDARRREMRSRFEREVKTAGRLLHPNIVAAFDAGEVAGSPYLVMEYLGGVDLHQLVRLRGPLSAGEAVPLIVQAARGLGYAHQNGVVHRDVKPSNLFLDSTGIVKVLDLGLARLADRGDGGAAVGDKNELTQAGVVMGTVDFMAPEQAEDTHRAEATADVYSLGCTLYYILTGELLFPGEATIARIIAHREK
ncbi:MAG: serine/threonine-protein kinase, partial [Planctomycetia bacterium]